jgi:putative Mn2+ efflux pump MntP
MIAKRDFGQVFGGAVFVLLGVTSLWKARVAFVYHVPIYFKGSEIGPWYALIGGALCVAFGSFVVSQAFQKTAKK